MDLWNKLHPPCQLEPFKIRRQNRCCDRQLCHKPTAYPENPDKNLPNYLETAYDLLAGEYPSGGQDLVLVVDKYNKVNKAILEELGFNADLKASALMIYWV